MQQDTNDSNVTFDFVNEYLLLKYDANDNIISSTEIKMDDQEDYVLNGIRLFDK